ncbi:MAG: hypothetical protein C0179_03630 [Fervidicoccus sp.]|nr:MAG: hypothetical protein C0179_03630 [Fervidicoccus sp.]
MTAFKEVSKKEFDEIREVISRFIESHYWIRTFRLRNLDDDKDLKRVIELFEENSTIKGSVNNATIYIIPIYYYDPRSRYGEIYIASLVIKRDFSGYTVKIGHWVSLSFQASSEEEAKSIVEEKIGGFTRLIEKALSIKHTLTTKLAELADCPKETMLIALLYRFYGDEVLSDDTIPGIHDTCSLKTGFFINDKVIVIPSIGLWVVRDTKSNKIFRIYASRFAEVSSEEKIFYDALFRGYRDLLEPEAMVKSELGAEYMFSSSETVVDGKNVSLVAIGGYDPEEKSWRYLDDIFAITCGVSVEDKCSAYSFYQKNIFEDMSEMNRYIFSGIEEAVLGLIFSSRRIREETKRRVAEDRVKKHTWEVLPA